MAFYFDKTGKQIGQKTWRQLSMNPRYATLREFENDFLHVRAYWNGVIGNPHVPPDKRMLFRVEVTNIISKDGNDMPLAKPVRTLDPELSTNFATDQEAVNYYEHILVKEADCIWLPVDDRGTMRLDDTGNKIAPLEPMPEADTKIDEHGELPPSFDLRGSW